MRGSGWCEKHRCFIRSGRLNEDHQATLIEFLFIVLVLFLTGCGMLS